MTPAKQSLVLILAASLLAGCGNSSTDTAAAGPPRLLATATVVNGVATFAGKRGGFSITATATGADVKDLAGLGGTVSVPAGTILQFDDVRISLGIQAKAASISTADLNALIELYIAWFNRVPDAEGLSYWIDQFKAGKSLLDISASFYSAALTLPAQTGYSASMSDADFVTIVYRNVLGRSSVDAEGMAYWTGALAKGTATRASLVKSILDSAHGYKGDASYGWVATLLDNKDIVSNYFAVQQGITYLTPADSVTQGKAIAAAVTATDVAPATKLVDALFGVGGPTLPPNALTEAQAARFLLQAQFSASDEEIAAVRAKGPAVWLSEQLNAAQSTTAWNWLDANGYGVPANETRYYDSENISDRMAWNQLLTSPDAVRKRAALALSEITVVSVSGVDLTWRGYAMASYWDQLVSNAFGNYRKLLEDVTLNPAMGRYLSTLGNQKENTTTGRQPDENYAREVMQLFTIGLYQLNMDGTEKKDADGNRIETYTQSDISNLARVFTGYQLKTDPGPVVIIAEDNNRNVPTTTTVSPPMRLVASQHSTVAASFLGTFIPANTEGSAALKTALDALVNHANTAPFICKQLIQRLVTSNPSPAYVARVSNVFANNGNGVRGDLKAVFSAILLDSEARSDAGLTTAGFGKVREPMLRTVQWSRTFADVSTRAKLKMGDLSNPATQLSESPLRSPSVFNFYRPGYVPPSTAIATAGMVAPEFQIVSESSVGGYLNLMQGYIRNGISTPNSDVRGNTAGNTSIAPEYAKELALVLDPDALVKRINLLMCANCLSADSQALIVQTLKATNVTAASSASAKLDRVAMAVFLLMATPEYLVQK